MEKITIDRSPKNDQMKQIQNFDRLVEEQQVLEMKHVLVSSKLDHLKNRMQNLIHDLRSPLSGITGLLDLLINEDKEQIEVQTCDLITIKESAQSLLNLINGVLMVKDTQNGEKESMNIDRKLSSVIIEINRIYLPLAKHKGISLSLNSKTNKDIQLPSSVFNNLIQITVNLIANAVKFTPSNGSINVDFTIDTKEEFNMLNINVTDTGKGMSPDQVSAFNQGKPVSRSLGTNGEQGFGIGLQHVHQMVSEGNGHIYMESAKESGTFFSLSLPLSDKNMNCDNGSYSVGVI